MPQNFTFAFQLSLLRRRMSSAGAEHVLAQFKLSIPPLSFEQHKGSSGKICVIGGSQEYTGAPYFAAISALLAGADLTHVICPKEAAAVIKSYSPELIVHPLLQEENIAELFSALPRFNAVIIGPGLGRSDSAVSLCQQLLEECKRHSFPIVIDADGIWAVDKNPNIIKGCTKVILTPNHPEFCRLYAQLFDGAMPSQDCLEVSRLASELGNITCVRKGPDDVISNGLVTLICGHMGSPRRCGGQGDILSGTAGLFAYWASKPCPETRLAKQITLDAGLLGAYGACCLTRESSRLAFETKGRSTTTSDLIANLSNAFSSIFH